MPHLTKTAILQMRNLRVHGRVRSWASSPVHRTHFISNRVPWEPAGGGALGKSLSFSETYAMRTLGRSHKPTYLFLSPERFQKWNLTEELTRKCLHLCLVSCTPSFPSQHPKPIPSEGWGTDPNAKKPPRHRGRCCVIALSCRTASCSLRITAVTVTAHEPCQQIAGLIGNF